MVRHIVTWKHSPGRTADERAADAKRIKTSLEALPAIIGGIAELRVHTEVLPACYGDLVLNSLFETEEALAAYQVHPEHKKVSEFVRSVTCDRVCVDFCE